AWFVTEDLKVGENKTLMPRQMETAHDLTYRLVSNAVLETLRDLNFGVDLPPPGTRNIVPMTPDKDYYAGIKKVGIVAGIGGEIDFVRGKNEFIGDKPVPGWNLQKDIEDKTRAALGPRFTVVDIAYDRARIKDAKLLAEGNEVKLDLPGVAPTKDVDALIVFL